ILKLLIEQEMNIISLKKAINLNPGTIKRHLTTLVQKGLVAQSRVETNIYGIKMKFYRATAKQFVISIKWP
ncbi:MAG: ArsR family transcriptional regulator, partial [Candidatus Odinarchaeota archaeon]